MERKMIMVFNHDLTADQKADAVKSLNVKEFVTLPVELKEKWSNISPKIWDVSSEVSPIIRWILSVADEDDIVLVQGEMCATISVALTCKNNGLIPVVATTERKSIEKNDGNGNITKISIFSHVRFRELLPDEFPAI